ncbi:MAG: hypothetical protein R3A10_06410 [Caldilineaceae bacterium]
MTLGAMIPPLWIGFVAARRLPDGLGVNYVMVLLLLGIALYLKRIDVSRWNRSRGQPANREPRMRPLQKQNRATDGHG